MIDHQRRFLACLCGLTAREANKHTNDYHYIGMEKGLSVFATNAAVAICRFGGQQDKAKLAMVSAARQQWKYLPAMGRMALTSAYPAACDASVYDAVSRHADFRSFRVGCERRTLDALSDYFHAMQRSL